MLEDGVKNWSIIIPARNEEKHLHACLSALLLVGVPAETFEILVADNGSTDNTVPVTLSFACQLPVRVLPAPGKSVAAVRNYAAAAATGRFLAFLDADCIAPPDWLLTAGSAMSEHPSSILGCPYRIPESASWTAKVWYRHFQSRKCGRVNYVPGGTLLVARSLFQRLGGFNSSLRSNEDSEFCSRARVAGVSVIAEPKVSTLHLGAERSLLHFAKRQMWHGSNVVNSSSLTGNIRAIGIASYTLVCLATAASSLLFASALWASLALLALLLPPVILAVRGVVSKGAYRDLPKLFVLLLAYALVRAWVLPLAMARGIRCAMAGEGIA